MGTRKRKQPRKTKRGGLFGIANVHKTLQENTRDYERIWKHKINPETNKTYEPNEAWYWPGWTSQLTGERPRPYQVQTPLSGLTKYQPSFDELNQNVGKKYVDVVTKYARHIQSICADSGVCFAFGIEKKQLASFFKLGTSFEYTIPPFIPIGSKSGNAFVKELKFRRENYLAYAVLKSTKDPEADNLAYEYLVGTYINSIASYFPIFVDTYGLFSYPSDEARNEAHKTVYDSKDHDPYPVTSILTPISIYDPSICQDPDLSCILIQHIQGARTMRDMITDTGFLNNEAIYALFQIYFTLDQIRTQFTHYDLHCDNVLLYEPVVGGYIHYHFHKQNMEMSFKSKYMVKIIDYGRSFFPGATAYYDYLCKQGRRCGKCGEYRGFWMDRKPATKENAYTNSYYKNESHDIKLLAHCKRILGTKWMSPELQFLFDTPYDGKENTRVGIHTIHNVNDASRYLIQLMHNYKNANDQTYESSTKIGDLHIYENKPMEYRAVSP